MSWYQNGKKLNPDDKRVIVVSEGKKRKLIIKDTLLSDAGEITAKTNSDEAGCKLKVARKSTKSRLAVNSILPYMDMSSTYWISILFVHKIEIFCVLINFIKKNQESEGKKL